MRNVSLDTEDLDELSRVNSDLSFAPADCSDFSATPASQAMKPLLVNDHSDSIHTPISCWTDSSASHVTDDVTTVKTITSSTNDAVEDCSSNQSLSSASVYSSCTETSFSDLCDSSPVKKDSSQGETESGNSKEVLASSAMNRNSNTSAVFDVTSSICKHNLSDTTLLEEPSPDSVCSAETHHNDDIRDTTETSEAATDRHECSNDAPRDGSRSAVPGGGTEQGDVGNIVLPERYRNALRRSGSQGSLAGQPRSQDLTSREKDLGTALAWIRHEMVQMKEQDKGLLKQFIELRARILQLRCMYQLSASTSDLSGSSLSLNELRKSPHMRANAGSGAILPEGLYKATSSLSLPCSPQLSRLRWTNDDVMYT